MQGLIDEKKIDNFNAPYYAPSVEEVKWEIRKEGSFTVNGLEAFEIEWDGGHQNKSTADELSRGERVGKTIRAVVEPMLEDSFGREIMDELFHRQ